MSSPENKFTSLDALLKLGSVPSEIKYAAPLKKKASVIEMPVMPDVKPAEDKKSISEFWHKVRVFYRSGQTGRKPVDRTPLFPALLMPYRDMGRIQHDFPVWVDNGSAERGQPSVISLSKLLSKAVDDFASAADDAKILKDNLPRLEVMIREAKGRSMSFGDVVDSSIEKLKTHLKIKGDAGKSFYDDTEKLKSRLPQSGRLVTFCHETPFDLLGTSLQVRSRTFIQKLSDEVSLLQQRLEDFLRVERQKSPEANAPKALKDLYGYGGSFINFDKFSNVIPASASVIMPAERIRRIEGILAILINADHYFKQDSVIVMAEENKESLGRLFPSSNVIFSEKYNLCQGVQNAFDRHMKSMADFISALRIASLEIDNHYDAEIHDDYFARFDWKSFTENEMAICPPVVMITDIDELMGHGLTDFSKMLASHKPIKTLVIKTETRTGSISKNAEGDDFSLMQELGAMVVSHRNTFVFQSTSIHPDRLFDGFLRGLSTCSPALFYVWSPKDNPEGNPYVFAGAALESRTFPEFSYDQQRGVQWGSRFNIEGNPQADQDWPVYELEIQNKNNQPSTIRIPFTFADFAAQDESFAGHFFDVPSAYWSDDLVLYSDYLKMSTSEAYAKIPFVWMVDFDNVLHKVATTHDVVLFGQERLDFWHFIQEFGGINSYHVERAVEKTRREMIEDKQKEIGELEEAHRLEIEKVRETTAREAMEKLSSILLDLDTLPARSAEMPVERKIQNKVTPIPASETIVEKALPPKVVEEVLSVSADPWLDTIRCTSCNECININPNLFKYNGAKQAYIADARSGSFAQLVKAAEVCPAKCIHPGLPINSAEAGLPELIKRAEPFN